MMQLMTVKNMYKIIITNILMKYYEISRQYRMHANLGLTHSKNSVLREMKVKFKSIKLGLYIVYNYN